MRVVHVSLAHAAETESDPHAAIARHDTLTALLVTQREAGLAPQLVQRFPRAATVEFDGVPHHFVPPASSPSAGKLEGCEAVARRVAALAPEVVHFHGFGFPTALLRLRSALGPAIPVVVQDHAGPLPGTAPTLASRLFRPVQSAALAACDALTFTSVAQAQPFLDAGLMPAEKRVVAIAEASRPAGRRAPGAAPLEGAPSVVWAGRLDEVKGPLVALQAFARTAEALPQAVLHLIWQGGALERECLALIESEPALKARVRLLGRRSPEEVQSTFAHADLALFASTAEGSGYALIEALRSGCWPVATHIPAFEALTAHGRTATLFPVGEAQAGAEALVAGWKGQTAGRRLWLAADAEARLGWPALVEQWRALYASLLTR